MATPPDFADLPRAWQPRFEFFHAYGPTSTPQGREAYRAHIEATSSHELDELLAELQDGPRTALLCLEEDPAECHRRVLCEALLARDRSLTVVDL